MMQQCKKDFESLSNDEKQTKIKERMHEYYEDKHKDKPDSNLSAHKAKIQDIRSHKKESHTFKHTDPDAVKYMCQKKGPEKYDILGVDHFENETTLNVTTPFKGTSQYEK